LSSLHLFKNWLIFNLICEFSNDFLHESPLHYNILVHKSWKLHQIFNFVLWNFDIYSISNIFLKLYKEDATTIPIASYRVFGIVNKAPCPQFHQYLQLIYKINIFCIFSILFIFSHIYFFFFTILMRIGFQWCVSTYKKC
jgi:hypothetical protein